MSIQEIYDTVYSDFENKSSEQILQLIEQNIDFILAYDLERNPEDYDRVMRLVSDFGVYQGKFEHYHLAINFLNKGIPMFEKRYKDDLKSLIDTQYYCELRFERGVAYYTTNNFVKSKMDFIWLNKNFPNNDRYFNWIEALNNQLITKITNLTFYAIAIFVLILAVEPSKEGVIHTIALTGLIISLIASFSTSFLKRRNKRRKTAH